MSDRYGCVVAVVFVVVILVSGIWLAGKWRECSEDGGRLVRGVLLYECVDRGRP